MKENLCLGIAHRISMEFDRQMVDDHCSNSGLPNDKISAPQDKPVCKRYGLRDIADYRNEKQPW